MSERKSFSPDKVMAEYFGNDAKKLNRLVDSFLYKCDDISQKDYDDFHSLAGIVFMDVVRVFDPSQGSNFDSFLRECLNRKFISLITKMKRQKRGGGMDEMSLEAPVSDDESTCLGDVIVDPRVDVEKEVIGCDEELEYGEKTENYLEHLSDLGYRIAKCIMQGLSQVDTIEKLGITQKQYDRQLLEMRSFEMTSLLY